MYIFLFVLVVEPVEHKESTFLLLTLEVPPPPLFKDEMKNDIAPQVPLSTLLSKFDGKSVQVDTRKGVQRTYRLKRLPAYAIFIIKRFTKNNWDLEKNPTVINFPIKNIDLVDCIKLNSAPVFSLFFFAQMCPAKRPTLARTTTSWPT